MSMLIGVLSVAMAAITGFLIFKMLFKDRAEFLDCLRFSLPPDLFSLFDGFFEGVWRSGKLGAVFVGTVIAGLVTYSLLGGLIQ